MSISIDSVIHFVSRPRAAALAVSIAGLLFHPSSAQALQPCRIEVVEHGSGWPVPLVELRTTSKVRLVTDNAGVIAFDLPEFMGVETWFDVIGHGYEVPKDGFGMRGVRLKPEPGATLRVEVNRTVPGKRIGRLTGSGLFAESQKLGQHLDWHESGITGSDTVENAVYHGKLYWAWGDTNLPGYGLGIYSTSSATTAIAPLTSFKPPLELPFDYFRDNRAAPRGVAKMAGDGPTWVSGYVTLRDKTGVEKLVCSYTKIRKHLEVYEIGQAVWNDQTANFDSVHILWKASDNKPKPAWPGGHTAQWKDAEGKSWVYFGDPFPEVRMPATYEDWLDESKWEKLQPQKDLPSASGGDNIVPHTGAIAWNPWRKRWVTVFMQRFGKPSALGELWYAEADAPTGPWGKAVKVVTHENYTFYNPQIHPEFTKPDSPILFFEGTYTQEFADHAFPTARYDYNQILYRLDLDDPALGPAQKP